MAELEDEVLVSLRRIMRATSIHSRKLGKVMGLTTPQLVVIRAIGEEGLPTASDIARAVSLSQATVTTILNRLEDKQLLTRERSAVDRRRVKVQLTDLGKQVLREAPMPLQESFSARFSRLPSWEQHQIVSALERVATMMDAEELDAAPLLASGDEVI
jgi:DNA-binding MarR family transcriptional regulator